MVCNALDLITCHIVTHSETDTNFIHGVVIFSRFGIRFIISDAVKCNVFAVDEYLKNVFRTCFRCGLIRLFLVG